MIDKDRIITGGKPGLFQAVDLDRNKEFWVSCGEGFPYWYLSVGPWNDGDRDAQPIVEHFEVLDAQGNVEVKPLDRDYLLTEYEVFFMDLTEHGVELIPGVTETDLAGLLEDFTRWLDANDDKLRLI